MIQAYQPARNIFGPVWRQDGQPQAFYRWLEAQGLDRDPIVAALIIHNMRQAKMHVGGGPHPKPFYLIEPAE